MARVNTSNVLQSLNMMLESQERRQATDVEQSLAAMNMAYDREQRHIENQRAERQLKMAEAEFFENQVVGLRADIEAEANSHLNALYNKYFKYEFDDIFEGKAENYSSSKKQEKWVKKFNNKGVGFSDADAEAIANQVLVYVQSGFTNHDAMRNVANMFKDKEDYEFDGQFVAAAERFGIYSTDPGRNRMAIDDFNRVFELDDAKDKLRQERLDIAKGDTEYDYNYDALFHGEKLKRLGEGGEEEDLTPNQTKLKDLEKMLEGKQPGTIEYDHAMSRFYESIGMTVAGKYNPETQQWNMPERPKYQPTADPMVNYENLEKSMPGRQERFTLGVNDYRDLQADISAKQEAMKRGEYHYSPEEVAHDQIKLLSLYTLNNARAKSNQQDAKIMERIETQNPEEVNAYIAKKLREQQLAMGSPEIPSVFHLPEYAAKEGWKIGAKAADWALPKVKWIGESIYDVFTATPEELEAWGGASVDTVYEETTKTNYEESFTDWDKIINPTTE